MSHDEGALVFGSGRSGTWPVIARIWQTVDLERTLANLGLPSERLLEDDLLGARGVLVRLTDEGVVAVLEPSTEGRLAASLARHGERETGLYVAPDGGFDEARRSGLTLGPTAGGPFGREALATDPGSLPGDSFLLIVEPPPATIGE